MHVDGSCRVLYCFDVGREIRLAQAEAVLTSSTRAQFTHKSRLPTSDRVLPPLRLTWGAESLRVGEWTASERVEIALYDLGALGVTWLIPFKGPLDGLVQLSALLYDNAELLARSRAVATELLEALGSSVERPRISSLSEDYVFFQVEHLPLDPARLLREARPALARVLRAEAGELSDQEIDDALASPVSYRPDEACLVDWLGAFLIGDKTEDERLVLELATVGLLELRVLDRQLDLEIDTAYAILSRQRGLLKALAVQRRELERVGRMQADNADLHEGLDNALKLLGDDYLARLHRTAGTRFHFAAWNASIERKLEVLSDVYQGLADLAAQRRSEMLEWIIIVLIAVELVPYLF
jgi:hypothetical protein